MKWFKHWLWKRRRKKYLQTHTPEEVAFDQKLFDDFMDKVKKQTPWTERVQSFDCPTCKENPKSFTHEEGSRKK